MPICAVIGRKLVGTLGLFALEALLLLLTLAPARAQDPSAQSPITQVAGTAPLAEPPPSQPATAGSIPAGRSSLFLVGYEGGKYFVYPFVTYKMPLTGTLQKGWTLKLSANGLGYKFIIGPQTITAWAPSGEVLAGYTTSGKAGSLGFLIGPQYRESSYCCGYQDKFGNWGEKSEVSATLNFSEMARFSLTGSYATVNQFYRVQGRPLFGHAKGIQFGPEGTYLGNPDIVRQQWGFAVSSIPVASALSLTAHGGYQHQRSVASGAVQDGAYYGVAMSYTIGGGKKK